MTEMGYPVGAADPMVKCKMFEDNTGTLTLANAPAMRPWTKHINVKYHHFHQYTADSTMHIEYTKSANQQADCMTKQDKVETFVTHRKGIMGW